jgi:hypothetical protein
MRAVKEILSVFPNVPMIYYTEHKGDPQLKSGELFVRGSGYSLSKFFSRVVARTERGTTLLAGFGYMKHPWLRTCTSQIVAAPYCFVQERGKGSGSWGEGNGVSMQPGSGYQPVEHAAANAFDLRPFGYFSGMQELEQYCLNVMATSIVEDCVFYGEMGARPTWMTYRGSSGMAQKLAHALEILQQLNAGELPEICVNYRFKGQLLSGSKSLVLEDLLKFSGLNNLGSSRYYKLNSFRAYHGIHCVIVSEEESLAAAGWSKPRVSSETSPAYRNYLKVLGAFAYETRAKGVEMLSTARDALYAEFNLAKPTAELYAAIDTVAADPPATLWPHY